MHKVLDWLITPFHIVFFFLILTSFHIPLIIARKLFGERAMWYVLERMCFALITNIRITGSRVIFENGHKIPEGRPIILVCNHQCMYDIPYIIWFLRELKPRFISKRELGKGLPSISFALRNGSQLLINRKDPGGAIEAIREFGKSIADTNGTVGLFPEGTRARDGQMKPFKPRGFLTLLETCPDAVIVPLVIDGSWEHMRYKFKPVPFGVRVTLKVLEPIHTQGLSADQIVSKCEQDIRQGLIALGGQVKVLSQKSSTEGPQAVAG